MLATLSRLTAVLSLPILFAGSALATPPNTTAALAKARNCFACHQSTGQSMGPGYTQIARKYAGVPDAATILQKKIISGGAGAWGPVTMPPNPHVSEEEARLLALWILAK